MKHLLQLLLISVLTISIVTVTPTCGPSVAGVETTNGFSVTASAEVVFGKAPPNSQVYLCDTHYIPFVNIGTGLQTVSNRIGKFDFAVMPGTYKIIIITPAGKSAGIDLESTTTSSTSQKTVSSTPELPGSITGTIHRATTDSLLLYLTGTAYYYLVTTNQEFTIGSIPPGKYRLRVVHLPNNKRLPISPLHEELLLVQSAKTFNTGIISIK